MNANVVNEPFVDGSDKGLSALHLAPMAPLNSTHNDDILNWRTQPVISDWNPVSGGVGNSTILNQGTDRKMNKAHFVYDTVTAGS